MIQQPNSAGSNNLLSPVAYELNFFLGKLQNCTTREVASQLENKIVRFCSDRQHFFSYCDVAFLVAMEGKLQRNPLLLRKIQEVRSAIQDMPRTPNLSVLPADVVKQISSHLPWLDQLHLLGCCKRLRSMAHDPLILSNRFNRAQVTLSLRELIISLDRCKNFVTELDLPKLLTGEDQVRFTPESLRLIFGDGKECTFEKLQSLNLRSLDITDQSLLNLSRGCPNVRALNLSHCSQLTSKSIEALGRFPHLRSLDLQYCEWLRDGDLQQLTTRCSNLEELRLGANLQLRGEGIRALRACLSLQRIHFGCTPQLTHDVIAALVANCKDLRTVDLAGCSPLERNGFKDWIIHCTKLEEVDVSNCGLTDEDMRAFGSCTRLRKVGLNYASLTRTGVAALASRCPALEEIYLRGCFDVGDEALQALATHCPKLRVLDLDPGCMQRTRLTDKGIQAIARGCPDLEVLDINRCFNVTRVGIKTLAEHCCKLKKVNLEGLPWIKDEGVKALAAGCPLLEEVNLSYCWQRGAKKLTDESLVALAACRNITVLMLSKFNRFTDRGLIALGKGCPKLQSVDLSHNKEISDVGVRALVNGCRDLRGLEVDSCPKVTQDAINYLRTKRPASITIIHDKKI